MKPSSMMHSSSLRTPKRWAFVHFHCTIYIAICGCVAVFQIYLDYRISRFLASSPDIGY
jgi:hypothetical protein